MKKVLSMVLAMATVASMASVAFAATGDEITFVDPNPDDGVTVDFSYGMSDIYVADGDRDDKLVKIGSREVLKGDSIFIPLNVPSSMSTKDVKKWKVKADWLVGEDILELKPEIAYRKNVSDHYDYYVELKTKESFTTGTKDVLGFISVYKGSSKVEGTAKHITLEFGKVGTATTFIGDDLTVKNNTFPYVYKFKPTGGEWLTNKEDTEVITFDGVGEFEGNFWEQGSLFLGFNTEWIPEVSDLYPDAELEFTTFPGSPMFNKWGTMRLYDPDETGDKFIYALIDGKMEAVETKYDDEYEAYVFGAKKLGTYIMSDRELDVNVYNNAVAEDETDAPADETPADDVPTEIVKENPGTGR